VNTTQISAPRFAFPSELTEPSVALASLNEKAEPARPEGSAAQQAAQQANSAASTMASSTGQQASPAAAKYTGEPISVNLKEVICATSSA